MASTSDPPMLESDWNAWAAGNRNVEVQRLERDLAVLRACEISALQEAAEIRERFEGHRTGKPVRTILVHSNVRERRL